jgi:hypothetical protein
VIEVVIEERRREVTVVVEVEVERIIIKKPRIVIVNLGIGVSINTDMLDLDGTYYPLLSITTGDGAASGLLASPLTAVFVRVVDKIIKK